ncbi:MAG TPA: hypothetical protein PK926_11990 [Spirochaetota bacterium]|nr:hypothetical protein [Spirochaetota bacterium]HPI88232.1 hypothetical protein [Spirochaetota bacterium]HPR47224.1 hypothetical protein [Spirochaetota bacterium]
MKSVKMNKLASMFLCAAVMFLMVQISLYAQQAGEDAAGQKKESGEMKDKIQDEDMGWRIRDFRPYVTAIKELEKLNTEYSENLLKLAIDEYSTGLDILEDMENEVVKIRESHKKQKNLNERWYWQEIDRKNQQQRQIAYKKFEAKVKSVTYLTKAINYLDEVQSPEVRQDPKFNNFMSRLFQVYVSTQYDLQNFKPCIPILERYISLSEKNKNDIWAYIYLTSCYGYMEKVLQKYKHATEDEILQFKNKKNRSMLQAVELKYGIESPHFKHIQEQVEQDEKKSERINDFR